MELIHAELSRAATLPAHYYHRADVLEREQERIFGRSWQLVGHEDQLREPGSFLTTVVADEPVLVVRGAEGRLRAFSNVCRHRAGPVARGSGSCKAFRCGYHGWSYGLDGQLLGTPEFDGVEGFSKDLVHLPRFVVDTWIGLLFVNLDPAARPLREELGELAPRLEGKSLSRMRPAFRRDWRLDCNWKTYVDNYLEGYHIPLVHPALFRELDYGRYRTETFETWSEQHAPSRATADGRLRVREGQEAEYFWVFPNLLLNVYPDNFSTNVILPEGSGRTLTVFEWFFDEPERPEVKALVEETVAFSDEVQREDIGICETVQHGLRSRHYVRGRYSARRENGVHHFHRLYARAMS